MKTLRSSLVSLLSFRLFKNSWQITLFRVIQFSWGVVERKFSGRFQLTNGVTVFHTLTPPVSASGKGRFWRRRLFMGQLLVLKNGSVGSFTQFFMVRRRRRFSILVVTFRRLLFPNSVLLMILLRRRNLLIVFLIPVPRRTIRNRSMLVTLRAVLIQSGQWRGVTFLVVTWFRWRWGLSLIRFIQRLFVISGPRILTLCQRLSARFRNRFRWFMSPATSGRSWRRRLIWLIVVRPV